MNFKQFLAEKALNSKVFASTIERLSSKAKLGFELEMWVPEESDLLIVGDEEFKGDFAKTATEAGKSLEDLLGVDVAVGEAPISKWKIVPDGSIQEGGLGIGIEVVSPPTPVEDALADLKLCFKWMNKHNVVTNSTTGLHLNLSIPDLVEKLDPVKLILFMGEAHILKSYERAANTYAQKHYDDLIAGIQRIGAIPKTADAFRVAAFSLLKKEKYRTVNLSKLEQGYLEFRTAGNEHYHHKFKQIESDVGRFLTVLELACDPDAERQEYLKKLAKLFGAAKDEKTKPGPSGVKPGSLEHVVGGSSIDILKAHIDNADSEKAIRRLSLIMKVTGEELNDGTIEEVSTKAIAEFKILFNRIAKKEPDLMSKLRKSATSQVELDDMKAFMKAFNLK